MSTASSGGGVLIYNKHAIIQHVLNDKTLPIIAVDTVARPGRELGDWKDLGSNPDRSKPIT